LREVRAGKLSFQARRPTLRGSCIDLTFEADPFSQASANFSTSKLQAGWLLSGRQFLAKGIQTIEQAELTGQEFEELKNRKYRFVSVLEPNLLCQVPRVAIAAVILFL
jgi:hypothetical protein